MQNRNTSLDVLRIFAAYMVLSLHVGQQMGLNDYTSIGSRGVQLFFIMSGFWGMNSLNNLYKKDKGTKEYYKSRINAILPLYYTILVFDYFIGLAFYIFVKHQKVLDVIGWNGKRGIRYLRYFLFLHSFLPSDNYEMWCNRLGLWTMSSFAFFYVIAPLIFKWLKNWKCTAIVLAVLALLNKPMISLMERLISANGRFDYVDYFSQSHPINCIWCFLIGVLIWQLKDKDIKYILAGIMVMIAICSQMRFHGYEMMMGALFIIMYSFPMQNYLNEITKRIILVLSESSFCLYLTHLIVIKALIKINHALGIDLHGVLGFAIVFALCVLICQIFYMTFKYAKSKIKIGRVI